MKIHCAFCGKLIDYNKAWRDSLSNTWICDKECLDKIQQEYAAMILGAWKKFNGEVSQ